MAGHVGLVGPNLFAALEERTIEAYSVRLSPRTVLRSDLLDWKRRNKSEEWNDQVPCSRSLCQKSSRTRTLQAE